MKLTKFQFSAVVFVFSITMLYSFLLPKHVAAGQIKLVVAQDGTGDYTDIQSAINALPSGGGLVFVREGTYTISSAIKVGSNITLMGVGSAAIIKQASGTSCMNIVENADWTNGNKNIALINFKIDGNRLNVSNCGVGVMFVKCTGCIIENLWIEEFEGNGIYILTSDHNIIKKNIVRRGNHGGIVLDAGSNDNIVEGNIVDETYGESTQYGPGIYIANENLNNPNYRNTITNNIITKSGQHGISLGYDIYDTLVSGNIINMPGNYGIYANSGHRCVIKDNMVQDLGQYYAGVRIEGSVANKSNNILIQGNTVSSATLTSRYGVYIRAEAEKIDVFDNDIQNAENPFVAESGANYRIRGNRGYMTDLQRGEVTGIDTGTTGVKYANVTFPTAYPSGMAPTVEISLKDLSNSGVIFGGIWVSNVSNTGFTWNVKVTTRVTGSTCKLAWSATVE